MLAAAISVDDVTHAEGDSGATRFDFTVSLSEKSSEQITVDITATDDSATAADEDFHLVGGIYQERNGVLMIEAENYTNRYTRDNCEWVEVPEEDSGTPLFANFINTYMQIPNCANPGENSGIYTAQPGSIEYEFLIGTTGEYQLYLGWDGHDGSSDSMFAMIPELSDGTGGSQADWWLFAGNGHGDADFATERWDGTGGFEEYNADDAGSPAIWQFDQPGKYTLRMSHRESGVAVDRFVLQRSNLPAPSDPQQSPLGGTLTFAPNEDTKTVAFDILGDGKPEPDERFFLDLSNAQGGGATIAKAQGVGTIINDDFFSIDSVTVVEGNSGTVDANLTISLFEPFATPVTVDYATAERIAESNDFIPQAGTVTFQPGQTSKPITIQVNGDTVPEVDETFFVNLSNSSGPGIGIGQGVVTITNDDGTPIRWTGNGNGTSWTDPQNWNLFRVPDATDDLVIIDDVAATNLVDVVGNRTIKLIASQEPLRIFGGTLTLTEGTSVVGDITLSRANRTFGNLMLSGDRLFGGDLVHFNGNVDGGGDLITTGTYTFNDGAMRGAGTTSTEGGMVIDTTSGNLTLDGRTLETGGTTSWRTGNISIGGGGSLHNLGSFEILGDQDITAGSGAGSVVNDGTFGKIAGGGSTQVNRTFTNGGTVAAQSGTLDLQNAFTNYNPADNTLTGGTYQVSAALEWNAADIVVNAAAIVLDGPAAIIRNGSNALANLANNTAAGSLTIQNGHNMATPGFTNAGTVTIGDNSALSVSGDYTQTAGTTELQLGSLNATGAVNIQGGTLAGAGAVGANVSNSANVSPGSSLGILNIGGSYTQTASGSLDVELGPGGESDQLNATGTATLGGTLNVSPLGGVTPNQGEQFAALTFASRSGDFAVKNADLGGGLVADTVYEPTRLLLVVSDAAPAATVTGTVFNGGQGNRSGLASLTFQFSEATTVDAAGSLMLWNHTTGAAVDVSGATLLDNGTTAVTWDLSGIALPDGRYTATLPNSAAPLAATHSVSFHTLPGDSDGDGTVGFADFGELAANFNIAGGPIYGPGDMDGDGNVGFSDFGILATNFNRRSAALAWDFGDALEAGTSFPTTLANNGARHVLGSGLLLGATVDAEADGQPDVDAAGDGTDEDGVTFATLQAGTNATITVTAVVPGSAVLNGWIDFTGDGDWDDAGEQVFTDQVLGNGSNTFTAAIPAGAVAGQTFARLRATSVAGYSYAGLAQDGEVEDYQVTIVAAKGDSSRERPATSLELWTAAFVAQPSSRQTSSDALQQQPARPIGKSIGPATEVVDLALEELASLVPSPTRVRVGLALQDEQLLDQLFEEEMDLLPLDGGPGGAI